MRVAQELMTHYQHEMGSLTFIPGDRGIFDVSFNETVVFSKHAVGRHPAPGEVLAAIREHCN